ncbi:MAG: AgmX/PglI C-terminal domain-containing protein [Myxococcota bacterium]
MKVVCDNCGAVYKVPDEKLVKPVNKATCRQCGHRMLIPRPRADADPNERTLVTAVPPTPMGAPMRELTGERKTTPIDDEPEKTLPGRPAPAGFNRRSMARDEVPVFPGTPLPAGTRSQSPTADAVRAAGGDTVKSPGDVAAAEPVVPQRASQRPRTPPPAPRRPGSMPSHPGHTGHTGHPEPRRATPRPMVRSQPPPPSHAHSMPSYVAHQHDPSGDMTIAMAGVFGTLLGIFILALLSVWPWRTVLWLGLAISIGGSITSLLILITGGRGTRPAWLGTSMVTGVILAIALATGLVSTHYVGERMLDLDLKEIAKLQFAPTDPGLPLDGGEPIPIDPEPTDGVVDGGEPVEPTPDPEPQPDPEPTAKPDPKVRPTPTPKIAPPPRPTPDPRPAPAPVPLPSPVAPAPMPMPAPSAAASDAPPQVSYEIIDVMLRTNLEVKKCFYEVLQTTGQLPPRVDVKFNLMPTGSVTGVSVQQPEFAGSRLEVCLGSAIRSVEFPPSSGNGQKIVYPFVLQ